MCSLSVMSQPTNHMCNPRWLNDLVLNNSFARTNRIPTASKFRTLFHVLDTEGVGHLTPGALAIAVRDVYDLVGLLGAADPHRDAMELYSRIDHGSDCR